MNRESEVAAMLRADATLSALLPGGIYEAGQLPEAGLTDPQATPQAYQAGRLRPCAAVHSRVPVSIFQAISARDGAMGVSQVVEVYIYAREDAQLLWSANEHVYRILAGKRLTHTWALTYVGGEGVRPAPELVDARLIRSEFQLVTIRRSVPV